MAVLRTNVKPASIKILLIGIAILVLVNLIARLGVFDLTTYQTAIVTAIGAIVLLTEVSVTKVFSGKRKMNVLDVIISVVGILALVGVATTLTGIKIGFLNPIQSLVDLGLMVFILIEIFR